MFQARTLALLGGETTSIHAALLPKKGRRSSWVLVGAISYLGVAFTGRTVFHWCSTQQDPLVFAWLHFSLALYQYLLVWDIQVVQTEKWMIVSSAVTQRELQPSLSTIFNYSRYVWCAWWSGSHCNDDLPYTVKDNWRGATCSCWWESDGKTIPDVTSQ